MSLIKFAKEVDEIIKPFGEIEVLLFYGIVAEKMKRFLAGKELAAKNWLPPGGIPYIIKRGSKEKPLFINDFTKAITPEFLETRKKIKALRDAKNLSGVQKNVWNYFIPRKLSDFFYATNSEGAGKPIDRIFFDLDRGAQITAKQAQTTTKIFVETVKDDKELSSLLGKPDIGIFWTGKSFHVFIFLKTKKPANFYDRYFQFSKSKSKESFTGRWADIVKKETKINVIGGHEKKTNAITIDPSQTPSGKLCRVPLSSLHMKDWKNIDGVSLPVTEKMLSDSGLIDELKNYTPARVIKDLDKLAARLLKQFRV